MGVTGRVEYAGACICNVCHDADEVEVVHKLDGFLAAALEAECYYSAGAIRQVLLPEGVVLVGGQSAVVYP